MSNANVSALAAAFGAVSGYLSTVRGRLHWGGGGQKPGKEGGRRLRVREDVSEGRREGRMEGGREGGRVGCEVVDDMAKECMMLRGVIAHECECTSEWYRCLSLYGCCGR